MSDTVRRLLDLINNSFAQGSHIQHRMCFVWDLVQEVHESASLEEVRAKAAEVMERYRLSGRSVYRGGYTAVIHILYPSCD